MSDETVPPPVNPLTKMINLQFIRFVAGRFFDKWLPNYAQVVTSDLRTAEHNKEVGGVDNSTHVHGLAEDFQLKFKASGASLSQAQAQAVYDQVIAPNWGGFTEFEKASAGEGYHIHWQLSREISVYSGMVCMAGLGVVGLAIINNMQHSQNGG